MGEQVKITPVILDVTTKAINANPSFHSITAANGDPLALCPLADEVLPNGQFSYALEIVKAVNAHEAMKEALEWVREIADANLEQDLKLRTKGARTLRRIADKCDTTLSLADGVK